MDEAEVLCDRIAVMDHAHIISLDTVQNLLKMPGLSTTVRILVDKQTSVEALKRLTGVTDVKSEDHTYQLTTDNSEATLADLFKLGKETGFKILDLQLHQPTLEDVFLKLTGHALRE